MLSKNYLSSESCCIKLKDSFYNSIQKQKLKNEFYFWNYDKILRKFYFSKRNNKTRQCNLHSKNKNILNDEEQLNFRFENNILSRRYCFSQKIKNKKKISKSQKCKIIGGGCGSSKLIYKPQLISFSQKDYLEKKFMQNYENFTNKKKIVENLENERQGGMQVDIILKLKSFLYLISRNSIVFKPLLVQLLDVYFIYTLTGSSQSEVLKQNEIKDLGQQIKEIKDFFVKESQDQPCCDLVFYFDLLHRFNSTRIGKDEQNKILLIQAAEFITKLVKFGVNVLEIVGGNFQEVINLALKGSQRLIESYQEDKTNKLFCYFLDIWVRKTKQFETKIWDLKPVEELEFYITIFNELCNKQHYESDLILLTLIKIDHYFTLALKEDDDSLKALSKQLSLNSELIKVFVPMLIQKSNSQSIFDEIQYFLKFTVQNNTYRFLTISILLKYHQIIKDINDFSGLQENIKIFLFYKYLSEKNKQVKVSFKTNKLFEEIFYSSIYQGEFQNKIIRFSFERREILNSKQLDLKVYEEKIDNLQDIEKLIAKILIDKWEWDIKQKQQDLIDQKDDVLLELIDLYIQQSIAYQEGNRVIQERQLQKQYLTEENQPNQISNAFQQILDNFLIGIDKKNQEIESINRCKILGILAEGGTGKSMLIKKIEIDLIQNANSNSAKVNYIPLLIKCNSLDPISPSIENYLQEQGVNQKQIKAIKDSNRNKVILLDGYDEYTGEYFRVYEKLKLHQWKNTKVIVTSRKEKLELNDACAKFSLDSDNGLRDETSFCIVKLEEFNHKDILDYCEKYFKQLRTKEEQFDQLQYQNDMDVIIDCMKNRSIERLLYLPINLYLFTRMIVSIKNKNEIQKIKEIISDQIGIQEIFFNEQFKRESQDFLQAQIKEPHSRNNDISQLIINSFFEYFQQISTKMFLNKGKSYVTNFLQIGKDQIEFKLSELIENKLFEKEKQGLQEKIIHYVNSNIITRSKEEIVMKQTNNFENKNTLIEFKHKSLFEYFVARAMKYDFDVNGDNIYKLTFEQLKEFNINKKSIMNAGQNQSEQQILIKLYKMILYEIESNTFYSTYHLKEIEKNSRYIQYVKRSTIKKNIEVSQIDIGASNILSVLFFSKFIYSKLDLNYCSFSKLYVSSQKSDLIKFDYCNLQNSYLKNLPINYDSCSTEFASFDAYKKVFDTSNIFSFNQVIWDKRNILYSITQSGFINAFKIENQNILLQRSKQLSKTALSQFLAINNDTLLVSSQYSLLLINSSSFELIGSYKFINDIIGIAFFKGNIIVTLIDQTVFYGSFQNGFRKINIIGYPIVFSADGKYLATGSRDNICNIWNAEKGFELMNTIQGHTDKILSVAFSEDGKYLATCSRDKTCKIWNAEKGFELMNTIQGHIDVIISVAFSADGKCLATGSRDKTCKIWNAEKGFELMNTIQGHIDVIIFVVFSVDGKYLATGSKDNTCKIWNAEKGFELINSIQGHTDIIYSVSFSANGKYLATGSEDNNCKIWNAEKGFELTNIIQGHTQAICSVAFSADGMYLATVSRDKTCKIWNAEKGFELINTIQAHTDNILSVAFSADGKYLATGSRDKTCKIWNAEKGFELINTIQGHTEDICSVAFSADGKYLATGSKDQTCKIQNAEKGFELIYTIQGHTDIIYSVAFSADGKYLATGSWDNTCKIWYAKKGFELICTIQGHTDPILSVAFSADGKYLSTGSRDNTCKIWNTEIGFKLIITIQGHIEAIYSVAFSAYGEYLATGSRDKTCKIWNVEKGFELINENQGHTEAICSVAFSLDGKYLATGCRDNTCKIWNVQKVYQLINTIQGHTDTILSVAFSADGKYLATGSRDITCKIWIAEQGFELINTIQGHTSYINSVAFSADGMYLATGSWDNTCKIWNVEKGFELINTIQGHASYINSVAFSADGMYLATGSQDETYKIWNAEKGFELINTIQGHTEAIYSVAFSADGKYLATGSRDKTCKIWNAEKGFELINTIKGHTDTILSVNFQLSGKYLSTGSTDNTCKIWNAEKGFELINTIKGHTDIIYSVAFSADGKYLLTGSKDKTCKIWNAENDFEFELIYIIQKGHSTEEKNFELIKEVQGHSDAINSVAFSADGKYLATGSRDETCKIWNADNDFELYKTIKGHTDSICSVAFSADGQYLATGSSDNTCKIWNAKDFKLINTIQGHTSKIYTIAFSVDGKYLATGSQDQTCKIWNAKKGFVPIKIIQGHSDSVTSSAFSVDGRYIATGSSDKTCKIWNTEKDFELINIIQGHTDEITSVAFSINGKHLATGSQDNNCKIWNTQRDFQLIHTIQGHTEDINSVSFSADGMFLVTGSSDKNCIIWDVEKGYKLISTIYDHIGVISSVAFSSDGKHFSTGSFDKTCKIYKPLADFELIKRIKSHAGLISAISLSSDGKYLASSSSDNTCKIYNIDQGIKLIHTIQNHKEHITSVAFSKDGKYLAGSSDKVCNIWNIQEDFKPIARLENHTQQISSIAFSSNGSYITTGSYDQTCNIWEWNSKKSCFELIKKIMGHTHYVSSVAFSTDGKYLATSSSDKTCKIWDEQNNFELIKEAKIVHDHYISSIAFSVDGKYLATGSWDKTCKIWDVQNKFEFIKQIQNDNSEIFSVFFSQDSYFLSICSMNSICTILPFNEAKNKPILSLNKVSVFQFSTENEFIYVEQLDEFYKVYVIKDFYPLSRMDNSQLQEKTKLYQQEKENEMIYLKYGVQFKYMLEF